MESKKTKPGRVEVKRMNSSKEKNGIRYPMVYEWVHGRARITADLPADILKWCRGGSPEWNSQKLSFSPLSGKLFQDAWLKAGNRGLCVKWNTSEASLDCLQACYCNGAVLAGREPMRTKVPGNYCQSLLDFKIDRFETVLWELCTNTRCITIII